MVAVVGFVAIVGIVGVMEIVGVVVPVACRFLAPSLERMPC